MSSTLIDFLARQRHVCTFDARWGEHTELIISGYLSAETPPVDLVSSVRGIVLNGDEVLVMHNRDGDAHIVPGGRVEEGETLEQTLRRELQEEAGVEVELMGQIGFVHLKHTTPNPDGYRYPYPDFFWPVFAATFASQKPDSTIEDDWVVSSEFLPVEAVDSLPLTEYEKAFLGAALSASR